MTLYLKVSKCVFFCIFFLIYPTPWGYSNVLGYRWVRWRRIHLSWYFRNSGKISMKVIDGNNQNIINGNWWNLRRFPVQTNCRISRNINRKSRTRKMVVPKRFSNSDVSRILGNTYLPCICWRCSGFSTSISRYSIQISTTSKGTWNTMFRCRTDVRIYKGIDE